MPKLYTMVIGVVGTAVVVGGIGYSINNNNSNNNTVAPETVNTSMNSNSTSGEIKINDPDGSYKLYSDPSITKPPVTDFVWGNGQTLTLEYDGSKTTKNGEVVEGSLLYQTYYVEPNGNVQPMGGGVFEENTKGVFTTSSKVFASNADGRPGFIEVTVVQDSGIEDGQIQGKNVNLGMYRIKYEVAE